MHSLGTNWTIPGLLCDGSNILVVLDDSKGTTGSLRFIKPGNVSNSFEFNMYTVYTYQHIVEEVKFHLPPRITYYHLFMQANSSQSHWDGSIAFSSPKSSSSPFKNRRCALHLQHDDWNQVQAILQLAWDHGKNATKQTETWRCNHHLKSQCLLA